MTRSGPGHGRRIYLHDTVYTAVRGEHLVDIDEAALAAQARGGTASMKDTVNEALERTAVQRDVRGQRALDLARRQLPTR